MILQVLQDLQEETVEGRDGVEIVSACASRDSNFRQNTSSLDRPPLQLLLLHCAFIDVWIFAHLLD